MFGLHILSGNYCRIEGNTRLPVPAHHRPTPPLFFSFLKKKKKKKEKRKEIDADHVGWQLEIVQVSSWKLCPKELLLEIIPFAAFPSPPKNVLTGRKT